MYSVGSKLKLHTIADSVQVVVLRGSNNIYTVKTALGREGVLKQERDVNILYSHYLELDDGGSIAVYYISPVNKA